MFITFSAKLEATYAHSMFQEVAAVYNATRLLNRSFNLLFEWTFVPSFILTFQGAIIGCILVFFKTYHLGHTYITGFVFFLYTCMLATLLAVLHFFSLVHTSSSEIGWKVRKQLSQIRKVPNSRRVKMTCHTFVAYGVQVGGYFIVKKDNPLVVGDMLANMATTVLLSVDV